MCWPVPYLPLNPPALTTPGSLLPPPVGEEPVDDELREVFLEETDEVLEILREYLPRWSANPDDRSALSELRRAFHTLKGSGRMVRALVLGELAWAVENLLNRVLEHSVEPGASVQQLLGDVLYAAARADHRIRQPTPSASATMSTNWPPAPMRWPRAMSRWQRRRYPGRRGP